VLQLIERATGGWGLRMEFFRVPYLLAGPWYLTWRHPGKGLPKDTSPSTYIDRVCLYR
jgi:hypothetical protein